jgi:predicted Zn finger-like uncharacterized protein
MRLVCPNCEAKYEVPEDAIPETGRDVQCANCGHAWFQMRPRAAVVEPAVTAVVASAPERVAEASAPAPVEAHSAPAAEAVATASEPEPVVEAEPVPEPEPVVEAAPEGQDALEEVASAPEAAAETEPAAPEPLPEPAPAVEAAADVTPTVEDASVATETVSAVAEVEPKPDLEPEQKPDLEPEPEPEPEPAAATGAAAYAVDDSVLAILREEAERETRARQAEAAKALETQTDLGLDQAIPVAGKVAEVVVEDPGMVARRTRLPDVEEINSTLRPSETAADEVPIEAMPVAAEGRSSFRSGFLLVMSLAIVGSGIYGSAEAIAEAVPALAGPLEGYVGFVDSLRLQLDGLMQSATVAINSN